MQSPRVPPEMPETKQGNASATVKPELPSPAAEPKDVADDTRQTRDETPIATEQTHTLPGTEEEVAADSAFASADAGADSKTLAGIGKKAKDKPRTTRTKRVQHLHDQLSGLYDLRVWQIIPEGHRRWEDHHEPSLNFLKKLCELAQVHGKWPMPLTALRAMLAGAAQLRVGKGGKKDMRGRADHIIIEDIQSQIDTLKSFAGADEIHHAEGGGEGGKGGKIVLKRDFGTTEIEHVMPKANKKSRLASSVTTATQTDPDPDVPAASSTTLHLQQPAQQHATSILTPSKEERILVLWDDIQSTVENNTKAIIEISSGLNGFSIAFDVILGVHFRTFMEKRARRLVDHVHADRASMLNLYIHGALPRQMEAMAGAKQTRKWLELVVDKFNADRETKVATTLAEWLDSLPKEPGLLRNG